MTERCKATEITELLVPTRAEGSDPVYALLQGYPATCFARVGKGVVEVAPRLRTEVAGSGRTPWELFFDLRLFDSSGWELHAWRLANGDWGYRRREKPNGEQGIISRTYPIWGYRGDTEEDWTSYWDGRGMKVWVPSEQAAGRKLALQVIHVLGEMRQPKLSPPAGMLELGLTGIVDTMVTGFTSVSEE